MDNQTVNNTGAVERYFKKSFIIEFDKWVKKMLIEVRLLHHRLMLINHHL